MSAFIARNALVHISHPSRTLHLACPVMTRSLFLVYLAILYVVLLLAHTATSREPPATSAAPNTWTLVADMENGATRLVTLTIGVKQRNEAELERLLATVSSPFSPSYRQHLSHEAVTALTAPSSASVRAVRSWLSSAHPSAVRSSALGEWIHATMSVASAELLLSTTYRTSRHRTTGDEIIRCSEYRLPAQVRRHIDVIGPTTRFPSLRQPLHMSLPRLSKAGSHSDETHPALSTVEQRQHYLDPLLTQRAAKLCGLDLLCEQLHDHIVHILPLTHQLQCIVRSALCPLSDDWNDHTA